MNTKIFINLPVKDLQKTIAFFTKLGFTFNPQFTNEKATCMIINEEAYAMLLVEEFFKTFTPKALADARQSTEVLLAFSTDSREKVDEMINTALEAGGEEVRATQDLGFMYSRSFNDLDGHIWEIFWMDPNAAPPHE
jgi:predicted lactoylglutathione lyase